MSMLTAYSARRMVADQRVAQLMLAHLREPSGSFIKGSTPVSARCLIPT
ncbi:hypothetical protein PB2503_11154 [Parvularcula bermudensis HTCC2503]|uniref:Uncharacterized protein n=1 Tax=Parvularcula bermudensis (strain ATCC BAA-594 / HTCC2503 / KCTC 12087) TaxID=314260 RepID=E0TIF9_PARBH|nr:hypothetical protein PB2503_11154 [Parvularcula bermudensis HTCC2503]